MSVNPGVTKLLIVNSISPPESFDMLVDNPEESYMLMAVVYGVSSGSFCWIGGCCYVGCRK